MKRPGDKRSFWTGGPEEHRKALGEQKAAEMDLIQSKLDRAKDPEEVARLEAEIEEIDRRYAEKEREIDKLLF